MKARDHTAAVLGELERTLGAISPDAESERRFGMDVDPADGDAV
jgi:hypothetical protein